MHAHDDIERNAYNAAFYALGLRCHWDDSTWEQLADMPSERERVRRYLESTQAHLLRAYDADFLTDAILAAKQRCGTVIPNWTDPHWDENGI